MVRSFSRFFGLIRKVNQEDMKEALVSQFTNGRTVHLHDMTLKEYEEMCKSLEGKEASHVRFEDTDLKKWRRVCLKLLKEVGVNTESWSDINRYVKSKKLAGKIFGHLSVEELMALSRQLRMVKAHAKL